jgi:hypothetical protein
MALGKFENGIEAHKNAVADAIEHHGVYVRHVPGYAYTVGCSDLGLPELLVEKMPREQSDELLRLLFLAAERRDTPAKSWDEVAVVTPKPGFESLSVDQVKTRLFDARTHYGHWKISAMRVLVPGAPRD